MQAQAQQRVATAVPRTKGHTTFLEVEVSTNEPPELETNQFAKTGGRWQLRVFQFFLREVGVS